MLWGKHYFYLFLLCHHVFLCCAQRFITQNRLDALLIDTKSEASYFTGLHTQFGESPTRSRLTIVPLSDEPIAVIPDIVAACMQTAWIETFRTPW